MKRGKAKVKWSVVCLPKDEGGLGVKSLKKWNIALMTYHIWSIITCKQSLWVKWIHSYRLRQRNFWVVDVVPAASWGWKKILLIRKEIRKLFVHVIGNGQSTSAWHDIWSDFGPLSNVISAREIHHAELHDGATVADLMSQVGWKWPQEWIDKYPLLLNIQFPDINKCDKIMWKASDGNLVDFSTKAAWDSIRNHGDKVGWHNFIWFSSCIPRHAFIAWLLMLEKLKTQDKMFPWDVGDGQNGPMVCSLCKTQQDTHNHLFFECGFSREVWGKCCRLMHIHGISDRWKEIIDFLMPYAHRKVARMVVTKYLFAAAVYFIWQERNARLFKGESRNPEQVFNIIYGTVRLKLMTVKFKESRNVHVLKSIWKI